METANSFPGKDTKLQLANALHCLQRESEDLIEQTEYMHEVFAAQASMQSCCGMRAPRLPQVSPLNIPETWQRADASAVLNGTINGTAVVGAGVGANVDSSVGAGVGFGVGTAVGFKVGAKVGSGVGIDVGFEVGIDVGFEVGS